MKNHSSLFQSEQDVIVDLLVEANDLDGFHTAVKALWNQYPNNHDAARRALKAISLPMGGPVLNYVLEQRELTDIQKRIFHYYFIYLGDLLIEADPSQDHLLKAARAHNTAMIELLRDAYDGLGCQNPTLDTTIFYRIIEAAKVTPYRNTLSLFAHSNSIHQTDNRSTADQEQCQQFIIDPLNNPFLLDAPASSLPPKKTNKPSSTQEAEALDPLTFKRDTKIGLSVGVIITLALVITAYSGTHNGDILKKFCHDLVHSLCRDLFHTTHETAKSAKVAARFGIFAIASGIGIGLCGFAAQIPRRLGNTTLLGRPNNAPAPTTGH